MKMRTTIVDCPNYHRRAVDCVAQLYHNTTVSQRRCLLTRPDGVHSIYAIYERNVILAIPLFLYIIAQAVGSLSIDFRYPFAPRMFPQKTGTVVAER